MHFFWLSTGIFAVFAALILFATLAGAKGAPQEPSGAATALCCAVIPYVFTRAIEGWQTTTWRREMLDEGKRPFHNVKGARDGQETLRFRSLSSGQHRSPRGKWPRPRSPARGRRGLHAAAWGGHRGLLCRGRDRKALRPAGTGGARSTPISSLRFSGKARQSALPCSKPRATN